MSNPTTLQSKLVPFNISTDGINYKKVVCTKSKAVNMNIGLVQDESDCGVHTGVGSNKFSFDVEGILNTTPNTPTEVSANEMAGYANNDTFVYVDISNGGYVRKGGGYITNYIETLTTPGFVTFKATVTGDGTLSLS